MFVLRVTSLSRLRRRLDTWMSFIVLVANSIYFIHHCRLISVECRLDPIFITTYVRESILQVMLINIILQLGLCCFLFLLSSTLSCSPLHPLPPTHLHTLSLPYPLSNYHSCSFAISFSHSIQDGGILEEGVQALQKTRRRSFNRNSWFKISKKYEIKKIILLDHNERFKKKINYSPFRSGAIIPRL